MMTNKLKVRLFKSLSLLSCLFLMMQGIAANAQTFDWAKSMGGNILDWGYATATDGSGNVYVTGYFWGAADFNPGGSGGTLNSAGNYDVYLAKYDAGGSFLWARSMGGNVGDYGFGVAVDGSGNVYVTGLFSSATADFNPGGNGGKLTCAGSSDVFLAKYDTAGHFLWAKGMGGNSTEEGYGVAVDGNDNVYVIGYFKSANADFNPGGSGGTLSPIGAQDVFLAKYDAKGSFIWAENMGGNNADLGYGVTVDDSNNVYVTGYFISTNADFDPKGSGGTLNPAGRDDVFLAKYDSNGNYRWAKSMGGSEPDWGRSVAVDGSGNVYVTGYIGSATANFNSGNSNGTLNSAGGQDVFVAKYDAGGSFLWAKNMGGSDNDGGRGVAVDKRGNVYVTGKFSSPTADFDPGGSGGTLTNADPGGGKGGGTADVFLVKYDPSGNYLWAKGWGGNDEDEGWGVTMDGSSNVYMTGYFNSGTIDFNAGGSGGSLTNNGGGSDVFLVKFGCSDTSSTSLTVSLLCGESETLGDSVYTATGIYTQVFPGVSGCDSTVTLDLTIIPLDKPFINVDSFTLGVSGNYATYQWIKDGTAIPGATDSTYTVTANGNYRVLVTNGKGCSDTSDVYPITNYTLNIADVHELAKYIKIYPNPAVDVINIQSPVKVDAILTDIEGRVVRKVKDARSISLADLANSIYLLRITNEKGVLIKVEKVVKQEQ